jgi:hypothetical protein
MSTATPTYFFHVCNPNFKQPIWFLVSVTVILQKVHCSVRPETDFRSGVDKYLGGGGAAACFGWGLVATPGKAKEKV